MVSANEGAANLIDADGDLTITGNAGSANITVNANMTAEQLADAVNLNSAETGVEATATSTAALSVSALAGGGDTMSFQINGTQINDVSISDTSDIRGLRDAINTVAGQTGVTATMGSGNGEVILKDSTGADIAISGFTSGDGGTTTAVDVAALQADGSASTATGGNDVATLQEGVNTNATVVGQVEFTSTQAFTVAEAGTADTTGLDFFGANSNSSALSSVASVDLTTAQGATDAIKVLDVALQKISQSRSDLGAVSNRLDSTISNLTNISVNVEAARSGIMDADFAKESTDLARGQILSQAATSMLAQANSSQQNVLSLLR
jgi:flagellin